VKLLLDTRALIWWQSGDEELSERARETIANTENDVFVSAASAMEVATKYRTGKLPNGAILARDFEKIISSQGFQELDISIPHARVAGELNIAHKDLFDRLLIAQAISEDMILVSNEVLFDSFAVQRLVK